MDAGVCEAGVAESYPESLYGIRDCASVEAAEGVELPLTQERLRAHANLLLINLPEAKVLGSSRFM
jgi:hypothetical protein